ncbi:MAG: glycosyltransferase [Lentisphaerae bacterium]|nr:MAG: glycosyltransferase [Lentisphaerota bacterium]
MGTISPRVRLGGVSVLLPTKREAANLRHLLPRIHGQLRSILDDNYEILVVDDPSDDGTESVCHAHNARYIGETGLGFAAALRRGFRESRKAWVLTMDADGSHDPQYFPHLMAAAEHADIVICSRYLPRSSQRSSWFRRFTSRLLNTWLKWRCRVPINDLSGGFKLYWRPIFDEIQILSQGFEVQVEITTRAFARGFRLCEIPFCYKPRLEGRSKAAMIRYGLAFFRRAEQLHRLRSGSDNPDYQEHAGLWRKIFHQPQVVTCLDRILDTQPILTIALGSAPLVLENPRAICLEIPQHIPVLRYLSADPHRRLLLAPDGAPLPFPSRTFNSIICDLSAISDPVSLCREILRVASPSGNLVFITPCSFTHLPGPLQELLGDPTDTFSFGSHQLLFYQRSS